MDQTPARRRHQRGGHLAGDFQRGIHIERTIAAHARLERFALDEFHGVIAAVGLLGGTELIDPGHMGMTQRSGGARLTQKAFAQGRGVPLFNGGDVAELDDLQGHGLMEHAVGGPVSHAHGSATEFPERTIVVAVDLEVAVRRGGQ